MASSSGPMAQDVANRAHSAAAARVQADGMTAPDSAASTPERLVEVGRRALRSSLKRSTAAAAVDETSEAPGGATAGVPVGDGGGGAASQVFFCSCVLSCFLSSCSMYILLGYRGPSPLSRPRNHLVVTSLDKGTSSRRTCGATHDLC